MNSACGRWLSHQCLGKCESVNTRTAIKWCLAVCMIFLQHWLGGNVELHFDMIHLAFGNEMTNTG